MIHQRYNFDRVSDRRGTNATQLEELKEKYGRTDLLPMWIADMDFPVSPAITRALEKRARQEVLGYTYAPDTFWRSITGWLGRRHGWKVSRGETDYLPGVKKGIGLAVLHFSRPGDKIVIQPPVYHSFRSVVGGYGRKVLDNPLVCREGRYGMDLDGLERLCAAENPRMLIVCNPHNPIGVQWSRETLAAAAEICRRHGMVLLSDEIYGDLVLGGAPHFPTASVSETAREVTVTIGAPSKSFNIPGLACAWTVVQNPRLRDGFFNFLLTSEFDTPPVFAVSAMEAAYAESEDWLDSVLVYIRDNALFAREALSAIEGVESYMPDAGFGLWTDFRGLGLGHDELTAMLVGDAKVAMSDGASFGPGGEGFMRMNIGMPRSVLAEGIDRIAKAIKRKR